MHEGQRQQRAAQVLHAGGAVQRGTQIFHAKLILAAQHTASEIPSLHLADHRAGSVTRIATHNHAQANTGAARVTQAATSMGAQTSARGGRPPRNTGGAQLPHPCTPGLRGSWQHCAALSCTGCRALLSEPCPSLAHAPALTVMRSLVSVTSGRSVPASVNSNRRTDRARGPRQV